MLRNPIFGRPPVVFKLKQKHKIFFFGCSGPVVGDFFLSFAKIGSKFGKISENTKNVGGKKRNFFPNWCRYVRYLHINPAATCLFLQEYFFWGKVGKNIFIPPRRPAAASMLSFFF
jgi:hypothetical protein